MVLLFVTSLGPSDENPVCLGFVREESLTLTGRTTDPYDGGCRWDMSGDGGVIVPITYERSHKSPGSLVGKSYGWVLNSYPSRTGDDDGGLVWYVLGPLTERGGWYRTRVHVVIFQTPSGTKWTTVERSTGVCRGFPDPQ